MERQNSPLRMLAKTHANALITREQYIQIRARLLKKLDSRGRIDESDLTNFTRLADESDGPIAPNWRHAMLRWPDAAPMPDTPMGWIGGDLVWSTLGDGALDLWMAQHEFGIELTSLDTSASGTPAGGGSLPPRRGRGRSSGDAVYHRAQWQRRRGAWTRRSATT